jgi:hypothetical protein
VPIIIDCRRPAWLDSGLLAIRPDPDGVLVALGFTPSTSLR